MAHLHAHSEMTQNKPYRLIEGSRRFLVSYVNSLRFIKQFPNVDILKGKMVVDDMKGFKRGDSSCNDVTKPR
jgi:hypothetical protein